MAGPVQTKPNILRLPRGGKLISVRTTLGQREERLAEWLPSKPERTPRPAPLTDFLPQVRDFQASFLPHSRNSVTVLNRAVRGAGCLIPPSVTTRERGIYGSVGLMVDRAALHLTGSDILSRPRKVLAYLTANHRNGSGPRDLLTVLERRATRETPGTLGRCEKATVGWLRMIGDLEPVMRGFRPFVDLNLTGIPIGRVTQSQASRWLASTITDDLHTEVSALITSLKNILPKGRVAANPVFGGCGSIIGSDGDLCVDECLIELKTSVDAVKRESVAQLLGYAALNWIREQCGDRSYPIQHLALGLVRQRSLVVGTPNEWLTAFGGPPFEVFTEGFARFVNSFGFSSPDQLRLFPPFEWGARPR